MSIKEKSALIFLCLGIVGASCKTYEKVAVVHDKKTYQTGIIVMEVSSKARAEYTGIYSTNKQIKFSNLARILQINTLSGIYTASVELYKNKIIKELELKENYKIKFVIDDPDRAGQEFSTNKFGIIYADQIEILDKK